MVVLGRSSPRNFLVGFQVLGLWIGSGLIEWPPLGSNQDDSLKVSKTLASSTHNSVNIALPNQFVGLKPFVVDLARSYHVWNKRPCEDADDISLLCKRRHNSYVAVG
jgi:hypothetical protein